jgi:PAS domain S-box-containing protein
MPHDEPIATTDQLELERERLKSLINSMGDGVIAIDEKLKIVTYNGAGLNILDVNTLKVGTDITSILKLVDKNNQPINVAKVITESKTPTSSRSWKINFPDGSRISLYVSIAPVRLSYGQRGMKGYVLVLRDITREKSLEEERDEFISVISHELRTPVSAAEGNISNAQFIFKQSNLTDSTVKEALDQAHNQITFLAALINDLSMLSRAERGKLTVEVEAINVHDLVKDLVKTYEPDAKAKGLELRADIHPGLELLTSSQLYVREILHNFLTNSIKYTVTGHVTLGARPVDHSVEFTVTDTGIGVSKQDQEKLFDKFFRSEDFRTRESKGTGLGLYITMKLARLIHADIDVQSELNKGSTFTITIPNLK